MLLQVMFVLMILAGTLLTFVGIILVNRVWKRPTEQDNRARAAIVSSDDGVENE
jgi:hypothetical protein